jgi:DNA-binding GntR family transcriptional regulator
MMVETTQRAEETGREYALRFLREGMVQFRFAPGSVISETSIAGQLGISRTPVREALIELSHSGVVDIQAKRSSRVSLIDPAMVDEAAFIRLALDSALLPQVCAQANVLDFEELERIIEKQKQALEVPENDDFQTSDNEFHHYLYRICRKELCYETAFSLNIHFERLRVMLAHLGDNAQLIEEHQAMVSAIRQQDIQRCRDISAKHVLHYQSAIQQLRNLYPKYFVSE